MIFSQTNINQEKVDWSVSWHVHSNPNKPVVFTVNSLEMFFRSLVAYGAYEIVF